MMRGLVTSPLTERLWPVGGKHRLNYDLSQSGLVPALPLWLPLDQTKGYIQAQNLTSHGLS